MATCKNCLADDLLDSDICGEQCVYCYGAEPVLKPIKTAKGYICPKCNEETKSLCNDICFSCYNKTRVYSSMTLERNKHFTTI